jgi:hypothetical protein
LPINLATWDAEIRMIMVPGQPGQKIFVSPISMGKSWPWWPMPVNPSCGGNPKKGKSQSRLAWTKNKTLSPK